MTSTFIRTRKQFFTFTAETQMGYKGKQLENGINKKSVLVFQSCKRA